MIDLHTHTTFSDGVLIPSELARRAEAAGYQALGITDHGDFSNMDHIIPRITRVAKELNQVMNMKVVPGIELTHIPPQLIPKAVEHARELGAGLVVVHGETLVEPVAPGTNLAALEAGADILAHPGLISEKEAAMARDRGVFLEISGRKGHSLTNGHVARMAMKEKTRLVINSDGHAPGDLIARDFARRIALGAGLSGEDFEYMQENAESIVSQVL